MTLDPSNLHESWQKYFDSSYFYDHGANPERKDLALRWAEYDDLLNTVPDYTTHVWGRPARWFAFRDFDDFVERDLQMSTFPMSLVVLGVAWSFKSMAINYHRQIFGVGKYGITSIRSSPFYRHWGFAGFAAVTAIPLTACYFYFRSIMFSGRMFYDRVILQNRDYARETNKNFNSAASYWFIDHPLAHADSMPKHAQASIELARKVAFNAKKPRWFKE